jgi:predicted alpha-1,2-mannosidase
MNAPLNSGVTQWVDPFLGSGGSELPKAEGIAATWFWPKAQVGNTHPGACHPFGMVSVCPYSGGYVTGYGRHALSCDGRPPILFEDYTASGFSHFQQSGTGTTGKYYNYLGVTPLIGGVAQIGTRWGLEKEEAKPGYYGAELGETGIKAELTVYPKGARHRYTFPDTDQATIAVNVSGGGLAIDSMKSLPGEAEFEVTSKSTAQGKVVMEGLPIHFFVELDLEAHEFGTWEGGKELPNNCSLKRSDIDQASLHQFGLFFRFPTESGKKVQVDIGFSLKSVGQARANMEKWRHLSFDQVALRAAETWEKFLGRIAVSGGSDSTREIFYTALYHSLIKPANFTDESPFWNGPGPCFLDLATMWDMYKTQLPLMISLYPEVGRDLVNSLILLAENTGDFPTGLLMCDDFRVFDGQANGLPHVVLAEAFAKGIDGVDWRKANRLMADSILSGRGRQFAEEGITTPRFTHTLDLAYASFCTAQIAKGLCDDALYSRMMDLSTRWRNVYDPETAVLKDGEYYEGGKWNYSFRLLHDMAGRIALYSDVGAFVADLDRFFGFGQPPCTQVSVKPYGDLMRQGFALNRFEGLNNQPDMEVPYAYIYAGRPDRTSEVVRAVMKYQYTTGRGGLPGNDDSGGTSSWYVWSAIGIFPVAGQAIYLIGSPIFDSAEITLGDIRFSIEAVGNSNENIYVRRAELNGQGIDRAYLTHKELVSGGVLRLHMGTSPSNWGRHNLPPSYPS